MARLLKPWKESASLIIAAKSSPSKLTTNQSLQSLSKEIIAKNDYKVLVLKRSSKSKFMPSAFVFPGGMFSNSDLSEKWAQLYRQLLGKGNDSKLTLASMGLSGLQSKDPLPIYREYKGHAVPSEVAFRICAIRETFEESGVLFCVDQDRVGDRSTGVIHSSLHMSADKQKLLPSLRKEANSDDQKFIEICKELKVVPDIWGLVEFSNWLTPTNFERRFDTAFFVAFMPAIQQLEHDGNEISDCHWRRPWELLVDFYRGDVLLFPPQVYMLTQLLTAATWCEASVAALRQLQHGLTRIFPVRVNYNDGVAALYPGDALYPDHPDLEGHEAIPHMDSTLCEAHTQHVRIHRSQFRSSFHHVIQDTVSDPKGPFSVGHGSAVLQELLHDLNVKIKDK